MDTCQIRQLNTILYYYLARIPTYYSNYLEQKVDFTYSHQYSTHWTNEGFQFTALARTSHDSCENSSMSRL